MTKSVTWNDDPAHFRRRQPSRRGFLAVGLIGGLGLTLDQFFRLQAAQGKTIKEGPAKSLIHIFLPGGIAHQDSFDPKPLAPIEYRGQMGTVKTKLPGVFFNEYLKKTADVADKITGLRIFEDSDRKMNRSVLDVGGSVLAVSQFTLYGDARRGKRPSFEAAAPPDPARRWYEFFVARVRAAGVRCETGRFQEMMQVEMVNEGPVTILLDSNKSF